MNMKITSSIVALEVVMVAGMILAGMAVLGFFEPHYSCNIARSPETITATTAALAMIFGSCVGVYRLNKVAKATVTDGSAQNLPAGADLA